MKIEISLIPLKLDGPCARRFLVGTFTIQWSTFTAYTGKEAGETIWIYDISEMALTCTMVPEP